MTATLTGTTAQRRTDAALIDCDIHSGPSGMKALGKYLSPRWGRHIERIGSRGYGGRDYPKMSPAAARADAWPPNGGQPGSDLAFMREQLLDVWDIRYGILNCLSVQGVRNTELHIALSRALNEWHAAEWLDRDDRLRASISVCYEDGEAAAEEIERVAADERFVQVILPVQTNEPLGRRKYWKMYEAAARHDLPIGLHYGCPAPHPITASGWPSFYFEYHCGMAQVFQAQVISLIYEGVFERYPGLKVVLIEGGVAWLPSLMWRLDAAWEQLWEEIPHVRRPPSEYIREHFWLTTQPMEEPPVPGQFGEMLHQLDMDERIMFATDYPHWDFDAPHQAFPVRLDAALERKIMLGNAQALYKLP